MVTDSIKATGKLDVYLYNASGEIKQAFSVPNLVVTVGKNLIASRLIGTSDTVMSHIAIGDSDNSLVTANTALDSELARSALAVGYPTRTNNTVTYSASFAEGVGTGAIVEAGIFNASSAGTMLCRTTFPVINKEASDYLTINWNVTIN